MQPLVSSLSASDRLLQPLRKDWLVEWVIDYQKKLGQLRFEGLYAIPVKRCCEMCQGVMNNTAYLLTLARAGPYYSFTFLGAFTKLRRETISFVSFRPHGTIRFPLDGFSYNFIYEDCSNPSGGMNVSLL